jgi:hypothetical protein
LIVEGTPHFLETPGLLVFLLRFTMEEDIIKKLKKLAVDHNTDAGRMIEKLVED